MSTVVQPPEGYVPCSENCGRWTNSGKCWTCCALADGHPNDVYQSPDSPDWAPPIEARDAEHRAELDATRATIEQLGKDAAALAAENERLRGELAEAKQVLLEVVDCEKVTPDCHRRILDFLYPAAPPPAESTPVQPAQPDDIQASVRRDIAAALRDHERRIAALEAKGEPGTHARPMACGECGEAMCNCACEPKGAKP